MKTKLLYGGLVLLAFGALLFGQATFGPSGGGSSSNTNAFTQANFDTSQFIVSTGGVVSVKDAAVLTNTTFKSGSTSAKALSIASGTNFIRDAIRPAIQLSTDPVNFAFEIGMDTLGILKFYSADAGTNVLWLDANGVNTEAVYLAPGSDASAYQALSRDTNSLLIGKTGFGWTRFQINSIEYMALTTNLFTNATTLHQAGAQSNWNGITMLGGQFTGNGAGLTNIPFSGLKNGFTNAVLTAGSYTNVATDFVVMISNGAARTNWLQTNTTVGSIQVVKDWGGTAAGTNIIVKATAGLIDRAATYTINANYGSAGYMWDGTNFWSIFHN